MAYEESLTNISLPANADLSDYQYSFVSINSSGNVALTSDGAQADGVLQNKPSASGRTAIVAISGVTKILAGGTCTKGGLASSGANGAANDAATGDNVAGVFLSTLSSGEIGTMLLKTQNANAVA